MFFKTKKRKERFVSPERVYFEYVQGTEKTVLDSIKSDVAMMIAEFGWNKKWVFSKIEKIKDHPVFEPGYIVELQYRGTGLSYIPELLDRVSSFDEGDRLCWIELQKGCYAFVEIKNGSVETHWLPELPSDLEIPEGRLLTKELVSQGTVKNLKLLFPQSYIFFYISWALFIGSLFTLAASSFMKFYLIDQEKVMVNKKYYTPSQYLPVSAIMNISGTTDSRPVAIKYTVAKGWHLIREVSEPDGMSIYEQRIDRTGSFSPAVLIEKKPLVLEE